MNNLLRSTQGFIKRNGSTILTCVGSAGVVATAVTAVKATPKAWTRLELAKEEKGEDLTTLEVVKVAGPAYIPSVLVGMSTIACIFGANILNKRQQAALMSAYALLDNGYKDYKKKVKDLYGEESHHEIVNEIAKDKYEDVEPQDGKELFYDEFSGRYFHAHRNALREAEYQLNKDLQMDGCIYLNEYFDILGLEQTDYGDYLGWSLYQITDMYWCSWLEFECQKVVLDDGLECHVISMPYEPIPDFYNY